MARGVGRPGTAYGVAEAAAQALKLAAREEMRGQGAQAVVGKAAVGRAAAMGKEAVGGRVHMAAMEGTSAAEVGRQGFPRGDRGGVTDWAVTRVGPVAGTPDPQRG